MGCFLQPQLAASGNSIRYDLRGKIQGSSRCDRKYEANDNKLQTHFHRESSLNSWVNGLETPQFSTGLSFPVPAHIRATPMETLFLLCVPIAIE